MSFHRLCERRRELLISQCQKIQRKIFRVKVIKEIGKKEAWAKGWLSSSKNHPSKAFCKKDLVPGKSELIGHSKSSLHVQNAKTVDGTQPMTAFVTSKESPVIKAELNVVAQKNVSFNFLDSLLQTLHGIADDSKAVKSMTCNRTKGTHLLTESLAVYAHEQLVADLKKANGFSILCDKATDITMKTVFCVNVRYLDKETCQPITRLYSLIPAEEGNADGLFKFLQETLEKYELPWTKVLGYASDGENLMQGCNNSVLTRMQAAAPGLFVLKCYCHTFHLVAEHASKTLSKTAEQLIHDVYNYFKLSPNRQKSLIQFQKFVKVDVHKILKPCRTHWLSVVLCVQRILEQWPALALFFVAEVAEANSPQAERILSALKSPYVKATLGFSKFVLGDLTGLNTLFQSNSFQLHALLPELERVLRMLHNNFMKIDGKEALANININDQRKWVPLENVYPGYMATETVKRNASPPERELLNKMQGLVQRSYPSNP